MIFRNFRFKIIWRVFLIGLFTFLFVFSLNQDKWYVTTGFALAMVVLALIDLIYFMESTNREIGKFLLSIKYHDFSATYKNDGNKKVSFTELKSAFREITNEFQNVKIEKELHYQYLLTIFEHSKTAIICYGDNGDIEMINEEAKTLFNLKRAASIKIFQKIDKSIYNAILNVKEGTEVLVKFSIYKEQRILNMQSSIFKMNGILYKMISFHDIGQTLEKQEFDSWQKLIRTLNHEIMNSVTPISSLSTAINKMLTNEVGERKPLDNLSKELTEDLYNSLDTIENRSKGLLKFVTTYKELSKLPRPILSEVNLITLIKHLITLMNPEFDKYSIKVIMEDTSAEYFVKIDKEMIEQVLINLIHNAIDALRDKNEKIIRIELDRLNDNTFVYLFDNGKGIEKNELDEIFIPFYTTKKNGSGIGLSLSRQIMLMHKGSITVHSELNIGTTFILKF